MDCVGNLVQGVAKGIQVKRGLTVYTSLPEEAEGIYIEKGDDFYSTRLTEQGRETYSRFYAQRFKEYTIDQELWRRVREADRAKGIKEDEDIETDSSATPEWEVLIDIEGDGIPDINIDFGNASTLGSIGAVGQLSITNKMKLFRKLLGKLGLAKTAEGQKNQENQNNSESPKKDDNSRHNKKHDLR